MKRIFTLLLICLSVSVSVAQDWHQVGMNFANISEKKIAVNNQGFVGMFIKTSNAGGEGFFWIYNPISMNWAEVSGVYNSGQIFDMDLDSDGNNFYLTYSNTAQETKVIEVAPTGTLTDITFGLPTSVFNPGPKDLFINQDNGDKFLVGINPNNDLDVFFYTGSSWSNLATSILGNASIITNSVSDVSGYISASEIFIGASYYEAGLAANGFSLLSTPIGQSNFQVANGLMTFIGLPGTPQSDKIILGGDGIGFPSLVTNNMNVNDSVLFYEYDGGGFSVVSGIGNSGINILNFDFSVVGGQRQVLVSDNSGAGSSKVYEWNGTTFLNIHPTAAGVGLVDDPNSGFAQHPVSGKPYVICMDQINDIKVFALNHSPMIADIVVKNACLGIYDYVIEPIVIEDMDFDSTWVTVTSSDQGVVSNTDLTSDFVNRNDSITVYNTNLAYGTTDGVIDLIVVISDGIFSDTSMHQLVIHPMPTIDANTLYGYPVCSTNGPLDLNPLITPQGGSWSGTAITPNGIMDPILAQQDAVVYYNYTDANGCQASEEISLTPFIGPNIDPLTAGPASCGAANGTANIAVNPGASNDYFIQWSTGDTNTVSVSNLSADQYVVEVIDTNGCKDFITYVVPSQDITVSVVITEPSCGASSDGEINLTVTGNGPFTYYWINGETSEDLTNLPAGIYSVMITDDNGCTSNEVVNLSAQSSQISIDAWANSGSCAGSDGGVTISQVIGGVGPYTFLWSNSQTSQNLINVGPGVYSVTVTDINNCTYVDSFTVSTYDGPLINLETLDPAECNLDNGAIDLTISATQNSIQSILWSNSATTEDLSGLAPGIYTVVVTDVSGCEAQATFEVEPVKPPVQPLCLVTVDSLTTTNLLVWERVSATGISHYNIYRETGAVGNYPLVGTVNATNESVWNDVSASPLVTSWRYKLSQVDDCGVESDLSPHHKTMHVAISKGLGTNYNIFWDDYEGIVYSSINLYRYDQANGVVNLATLPSSNNSYTDDPGNDTINLDYFVGFDIPSPCTSSRAQDYNGTRSNRSAGVFNPGDGIDDLSIFENNGLSDLITVYPNPNNGQFTVLFGNSVMGQKQIRILDSRGRIVVYKKTSSTEIDLNLVHLEQGVYFVEVFNNNKKGVKKIIIQ